jgi:uncharacterized protein
MDESGSGVPRFAADRMLARVARWLRLCGADVSFDPNLGGSELLRAARREGRLVLSRDKRLRTAPEVFFIESNLFREQLREVLARFAIDPRLGALTRCSQCNSNLREAGREAVRQRVPPFVYASQDRFSVCGGCGRIYWRATHRDRILTEIAGIEDGGQLGVGPVLTGKAKAGTR